MLMYK